MAVVDHSLLLLVSEFDGRRVQALSRDGEPLAVFEPPGRSRLLGVSAAPPSEGGGKRVWVCDFDADCIHELSLVELGVGDDIRLATPRTSGASAGGSDPKSPATAEGGETALADATEPTTGAANVGGLWGS